MEFLSLSGRRSSSQNIPSGKERGETAVFAGYAFDLGWNFGILGDEADEMYLLQPLQWQQQEFYWWCQFVFFQIFLWFFQVGQFVTDTGLI